MKTNSKISRTVVSASPKTCKIKIKQFLPLRPGLELLAATYGGGKPYSSTLTATYRAL